MGQVYGWAGNIAGNVALGVTANVVFAFLIVLFSYLLAMRRQRRFALMLGATARHPRVEIIVSNLYLDGENHRALGSETTTRGYRGAAVAQTEIEAALALKDHLTRWRIPLLGDRSFDSLRLIRVAVRIRASGHSTYDEAAQGFVDSEDRHGTTRAIVLIGSPAFNRASWELLGPTSDTAGAPMPDAEPVGQTAESRAPTVEARRLQEQSMFWWVKELPPPTADPETLRYPRGARNFKAKDGAIANIAGRTQDTTAGQLSWEQSLVQQIHVPVTGGERSKLTGKTITMFAGVGGGGTAAAVWEFLSGERDWNRIRRALDRANGTRRWSITHGRNPNWPEVWAHWWTRLVDDPDHDHVDFDNPDGLPGAGTRTGAKLLTSQGPIDW